MESHFPPQPPLSGLTHELLLRLNKNKSIYTAVAVLETLQVIHFVCRAEYTFGWTFSGVNYFPLALGYISLDSLLKLNPSLFSPLLVLTTTFLLLTLLVGGIATLAGEKSIGTQVGQEKKNRRLDILLPILSWSLLLLKHLLQIPYLIVIGVGLSPSLQLAMGIPTSPWLYPLLSVINLLCLLAISAFIGIYLRESNIFSENCESGQSLARCALSLTWKVILAAYCLIDSSGQWGLAFCIAFTVGNTLHVVWQHSQTGYYNEQVQTLSINLRYVLIAFGMSATTNALTGEQVVTLTYLGLICVLFYIFSQYVKNELDSRVFRMQFILIEEETQLEKHVLHIVKLIECIDRRQCRIELEGYLRVHKRQCHITDCNCQRFTRDVEGEEEARTLFFKLLVQMLIDAKRRFPKSTRIHLLLAFIYNFRIGNPLQAINSIAKVCSIEGHWLERVKSYHYLRVIETEMLETDEKENFTKVCDVNRYFKYSCSVVLFEESVKTCSLNHIQFWKQLLETNTDTKVLEKMGSLITNSKETVREQFEELVSVNPNNVHTLLLYDRFLIAITNEEVANLRNIEKAQAILKNIKESSKLDEEVNKYNDNAKTAVVIISGNEGHLGIVVYVNNFLQPILGYSKEEIIGSNVSLLMPKIFGEHHDTVLSNYLASSSSKVNGRERIVTALRKDGYMTPMSALSKVLPDILRGIQIVAFLSLMEERMLEEEENNRKYSYMLYRCDNELIVGVSSSCHSDFNIPACLVYGNPSNTSNELHIKDIFGVSFQKAEGSSAASSLQSGEVSLKLDTQRLMDEFIIPKGSSKLIGDFDQQRKGVRADVVVKIVLSVIYNSTPLRLISIHAKDQYFIEVVHSYIKEQNFLKKYTKQLSVGKSESEDVKNLKNFKTFISLRSEPSAISKLNLTCLILILILLASVAGLLVNWGSLTLANSQILLSLGNNMENEALAPELLFQMEKLYLNQHSSSPFNNLLVISQIAQIIAILKQNEKSELQLKYWFDPSYSQQVLVYSVDSRGAITSSSYLIDQAFTYFISQVEIFIATNISSLSTGDFKSSANHIYYEIKQNQIYSLRQGLNSTRNILALLYDFQVQSRFIIVIGLSATMVVAIFAWLALSVPNVLSVTKINNRVLSLFCLIPHSEIHELIEKCKRYLFDDMNVSDLNVQESIQDNLDSFRSEDPLLSPSPKQISSQVRLMRPECSSPKSLMVTEGFRKDRRLKEVLHARGASVASVEEKFQRMINAEDRNKKTIILKFLLSALVILGYVTFIYTYSQVNITFVENEYRKYSMISRRVSLLQNGKLLLSEYLINSSLGSPASTLAQLNFDLISEFYSLQSQLLGISEGDEQLLIDTLNNQDICSRIPQFQSYQLFTQNYSEAECRSLFSNILQKGIKTAIVTFLEDMRSALYPPIQQPIDKIISYERFIKYMLTPLQEVLWTVSSKTQAAQDQSFVVMIYTTVVFVFCVFLLWRTVWKIYVENLNIKIWRTKGMLNIIPMKIITNNELLKNQFTSGQLENAVK